MGALLPPDLLTRLANSELEHLKPSTYGLPESFTLRQAAARAWELLLPTYRSFQTRLAAMTDSDPATVVTRDRWTSVLLRELGYDLTTIPNIQIEDDTFDVRYLDGHVPVHLLGWNVDLDKRASTNVRGASRSAPHSLIQELLNRTDKHLWAILTNGKRLRLLRDNIVMGRPAYIEFDLEGMFTGEQFADFAILYALAHATRLRSEQPADCILEQWRTAAINDGTRALDHLRDGVVEALKSLGTGFLEHPDSAALRDLLRGNHGASDDYYRWLLRLVYRLIFLFVAEDRDLLHPEDTPTEIRRRYADYFSTQHLRELATRRRAGRHTDTWAALRLVFDALGNDGEPGLGLPAYGSDLFNAGFIGTLNDAKISNERLMDAVRSLSQLPDPGTGTLRPVDYKNLGSEELGSVYEALLEYVPTVGDDGAFNLGVQSGNARKTSGSYYTPTELVELLLDESLDPVLDEASAAENPIEALLAITVCDPACGSGHFLVAAARRIARRLAIARTGDPEPTPDAMREALREVVAHCIYGVDLSDLAAELAKVSLWLESLTPGKPLAFLDAHIKVGNGFIGASPRATR
ncbi:N-6 DNA methylase [Nocardioides panacis]|uniref:site-specific DNA-methyltransferase (adenine-specific) n=1 Tax=Nocardioides panacis TaxID=2849501 RepID=A0A975SXL6_9ACTN|nr:DNA methyltransferase [Nocardioides panacis]QWZ07726.1 N-6 DNA methylase [Nocardioides panacis]